MHEYISAVEAFIDKYGIVELRLYTVSGNDQSEAGIYTTKTVDCFVPVHLLKPLQLIYEANKPEEEITVQVVNKKDETEPEPEKPEPNTDYVI